MPLWIALGIIGVIIVAFIVALSIETGPTPADVAQSYEYALAHLDFDALWYLSSTELRGGLTFNDFVQGRSAELHAKPLSSVEIIRQVLERESGIITTKVNYHQAPTISHQITLAKRNARWQIVDIQEITYTPEPSITSTFS